MPALVLSDPHFHGFKAFSKMEAGGFPSRLLLIEAAFREAVRFGANHNCNYLLIPGDVFHTRAHIRPSVGKVVKRCLIYAMDHGMEPIISVGNHDLENYNYDVSSLDMLDGFGRGQFRIHIVMEPVALDTSIGKIAAIPYCHDLDDFRREYERIAKGNPRIILIHQGVDDFRPHGNMPETKLTASYLESVTNAWVIAGHYHYPMINPTHSKVFSPGALVQHNFGDAGSTRFCYVLTDDDQLLHHKIESHPSFQTVSVSNVKEMRNVTVENIFTTWKIKNKRLSEKIKEYCQQNNCPGFAIRYEKEFATAHSQTIGLSTPTQMLGEYIDMKPDLVPHKRELLSMYNELCGEKV